MGLNLLSSVYLLSSEVMAANVTTKPVPKKRSKTNFIYSDQSIEHPDINNSSKVMIDGGLFANQKFDKVENLNKKTPVSNTILETAVRLLLAHIELYLI